MGSRRQPSDMELAALIASKICHDVIGPVGAIYNGLEIVEDDDGNDARAHALDVVRNVTQQASARLQFARFAFGASGSAGSTIDLATAGEISQGYVGTGKHALHWHAPPGQVAKDKAKLLMNLISSAMTALPRGGTIEVGMTGPLERPAFVLRCSGASARLPQYLAEFVRGAKPPEIDALTIQAYYTWRLAGAAGMRLDLAKEADKVLMVARPV